MTFEGISNERIVTWVTDNTGIAENAIPPAIEYVWTTTGVSSNKPDVNAVIINLAYWIAKMGRLYLNEPSHMDHDPVPDCCRQDLLPL